MHIPDGVLSAPTAIGAGIISVGALAVAVRRFQKESQNREQLIPVLGILAAFVFAAQMINFPIPGGTSGHLVGAVLAAVFLGPWGAMLVLALVLVIQCFVYADGGVTALGANIFNMAVIGGIVGWLSYTVCRLGSGDRGRVLLAAAIAAWFSIVAAAVACAMELAISGTVPAHAVIPAMTYVHMVIGIGEALITVAVVGYVLTVRPELIRGVKPAHGQRKEKIRLTRREVAVAVVACLVIAVVVSSLASAAPDGLEKVAEKLGFSPPEEADAVLGSPMPDYGIPRLGEGFVSTAVAGGAGVIILLGLGWLLYRSRGKAKAV
jgi:cobalt/nickel transport system permease protein